jgi:hypothetical protein
MYKFIYINKNIHFYTVMLYNNKLEVYSKYKN